MICSKCERRLEPGEPYDAESKACVRCELFIAKATDKQQFHTGAVRDTATDKVRLDLLPWEELGRIAWHYTKGAEKYSDRNWEKGIPSSRCLLSLLRHVSAYASHKTDEDHLSAIVFNALAIMFNERRFAEDPDICDLPKWGGGGIV